MNKIHLLKVFLLISLTFFSNCGSKELSRSQAQSLIEKSDNFKQPFALELLQGEVLQTYGKSMYILKSGVETPDQAAARRLKEYFERNPQLALANHLGLVEVRIKTLNSEQPMPRYTDVEPKWRFEEDYLATDKAKELWKEYDLQPTERSFPLAGKEIVEITGITKQGEDQAVAQFTWKYVPNDTGKAFDKSTSEFKALPSELQQLLDGTLPPSELVSRRENKTMAFSNIRQGQALFRRYDDGWRLEFVAFI